MIVVGFNSANVVKNDLNGFPGYPPSYFGTSASNHSYGYAFSHDTLNYLPIFPINPVPSCSIQARIT